MKLYGEEHKETLQAATNYASALSILERYGEAKTLLRKTVPVAQRVLGPSHEFLFRTRGCYGQALYMDAGATLDDLREAVATLEDTTRTTRRVLGGAHPIVAQVEDCLHKARAALCLRTL